VAKQPTRFGVTFDEMIVITTLAGRHPHVHPYAEMAFVDDQLRNVDTVITIDGGEDQHRYPVRHVLAVDWTHARNVRKGCVELLQVNLGENIYIGDPYDTGTVWLLPEGRLSERQTFAMIAPMLLDGTAEIETIASPVDRADFAGRTLEVVAGRTLEVVATYTPQDRVIAQTLPDSDPTGPAPALVAGPHVRDLLGDYRTIA